MRLPLKPDCMSSGADPSSTIRSRPLLARSASQSAFTVFD